MPNLIEQTKEPRAVEYSYRDNPLIVTRGSPLPAGAVATPAGINFVLLCRHGTAVWLILSEPCDGEIHAEIPLDPAAQSDRRPLARPGRRPAATSFATGIASTDPRTTAIDSTPGSSCTTPTPGHFRAAGRGGSRATFRAAA